MRPDLDAWAAAIDARVEAGQDPFLAVVDTDPRESLLGAVQLSLDLRG